MISHLIPWPGELSQYIGMIFICMIVPPAVMIGFNAGTEEFKYVIAHLKPCRKGGSNG